MKYWIINDYLIKGYDAGVALRKYGYGIKFKLNQKKYISIKRISEVEYDELIQQSSGD